MSADAAPIAVPEPQPGRPEISMAPLIDVVFLLLIFFMVATVFPDNSGLTIEKPESEQTAPLPADSMVFTVTAAGEVAFAERLIEVGEIEALVRDRLRTTPDTSVLLQVDRRATTDILIRVMDACKGGGAGKVAIATNAVDTRR